MEKGHAETSRRTTGFLAPQTRCGWNRLSIGSGLLSILVIVVVILSGVLVFRSPDASAKAQPGSKPAAATGKSGLVYFRPVLCFAPAYSAPSGNKGEGTSSSNPIPACAPASQLTAANLAANPIAGIPADLGGSVTPDPEFAPYPSTSATTPGYASSSVLLPGIRTACGATRLRCVLGPAAMTSRAIAKASVKALNGGWVVYFSTAGRANSALWDKTLQQSFHQLLGVELDGVVYSAPLIEPAESVFSSFAGRGEISGSLTRAQAVQLAKAMTEHRG